MPLEALQHPPLRAGQKFLLPARIAAMDTKTNIHAAADGLIGHDLVDVGRGVEDVVEDLCFFVRDGLLAGDFE